MLKTILACALGAAGVAPPAVQAQAQGYPTKAVRFIAKRDRCLLALDPRLRDDAAPQLGLGADVSGIRFG